MNRYINRGPQNAFIKGMEMKRKARYSTEEFSEKYDEYAPMVYRICALRLGKPSGRRRRHAEYIY